jgi:membrane associated rhomboid family serine protease
MQEYRPSGFNVLPTVIKNLFIINVLFLLATFVFQNQFSIDLADTLGLHLPNSEKFRPYQLITYMFMHADMHHLVSNMIALWIFGSMLEYYWGPKRFLAYYLLTGIGAAIFHYLIMYYDTFAPVLAQLNAYPGYSSPMQFLTFYNSLPAIPYTEGMHALTESYNHFLQTDPNPSALMNITDEILARYREDLLNLPVIVGASGSVFGVLLAYGMLFPNSYPFLLIPVKAKWIVLLYGASELFAEFQNNPGDNVAHFAHLGGMLFGFILIKYWQRTSNRFY